MCMLDSVASLTSFDWMYRNRPQPFHDRQVFLWYSKPLKIIRFDFHSIATHQRTSSLISPRTEAGRFWEDWAAAITPEGHGPDDSCQKELIAVLPSASRVLRMPTLQKRSSHIRLWITKFSQHLRRKQKLQNHTEQVPLLDLVWFYWSRYWSTQRPFANIKMLMFSKGKVRFFSYSCLVLNCQLHSFGVPIIRLTTSHKDDFLKISIVPVHVLAASQTGHHEMVS